MSLQTYQFSDIVSRIAAATQASAKALLNYNPGSVLRAIAEATAAQLLWLQAIVLQLLTLTRASTSAGTDLDSWMADYGLSRLPASYATGLVTFSRFTDTQQAQIPPGLTVQTSDGTQQFAVTADTTNTAWNSVLGAYVLQAGTPSVTVPVQAVNPGTQGNVQPGTVTTITSASQGVDTATNASAFTNGIDAESDTAFRARFVLYLASLSKATRAAVGYAITSTRQGLSYTITENTDHDGTPDLGFFTVVVDDGTGSPSDTTLNNVSAAIELVRPLGSRFGVFAPTVAAANVALTVTTAPGYTHATVAGSVATALRAFINGLPLATGLPYSQLAAIAYSVPGVTNVTGVTLNSGTSDIIADAETKVVAGTVAVA